MKLTTKLLLATTLACSALTSYGATVDYYGGVLLGMNSVQNNKDLSVYQTRGNPGKTFSLVPQSNSYSTPTYGLFFGARHHINQFFVGGEVSVQLQNSAPRQNYTKTSATYTNDVQESLGTSVNIALIPGISLSSTWDVYGKLGYIASQFKTSGNNPGDFGPYGDFSQTVNGINLGIGAAYHFNKHWSTALEYNYVRYATFGITGNDDQNVDGGAWGKVTANYKLSSNAILLKTSYWF